MTTSETRVLTRMTIGHCSGTYCVAGPLGELMFLVTDHGSPFAEVGFGNRCREKCNKAGLTRCAAILALRNRGPGRRAKQPGNSQRVWR